MSELIKLYTLNMCSFGISIILWYRCKKMELLSPEKEKRKSAWTLGRCPHLISYQDHNLVPTSAI